MFFTYIKQLDKISVKRPSSAKLNGILCTPSHPLRPKSVNLVENILSLFLNLIEFLSLLVRLVQKKHPSILCFFFKCTTIIPLVNAGFGSDLKLLSILDIRILCILSLTFGEWPLGIPVIFFNKIILAKRRSFLNSFGNCKDNLMKTA